MMRVVMLGGRIDVCTAHHNQEYVGCSATCSYVFSEKRHCIYICVYLQNSLPNYNSEILTCFSKLLVTRQLVNVCIRFSTNGSSVVYYVYLYMITSCSHLLPRLPFICELKTAGL